MVHQVFDGEAAVVNGLETRLETVLETVGGDQRDGSQDAIGWIEAYAALSYVEDVW